MSEEQISHTADFIRKEFSKEGSGHDWWHIYRVWQNARKILSYEHADAEVVQLAVLLHELPDEKLFEGGKEQGIRRSREWLNALDVPEEKVNQIEEILRRCSFRDSIDDTAEPSQELAIVRDADRLDALGAIGIARCFTFNGYKGNMTYDPDNPPNTELNKEEYQKDNSPAINHFYEKLFRLKDLMHTEQGRAMAEHRHQYMEQFIDEFFQEWEGRR